MFFICSAVMLPVINEPNLKTYEPSREENNRISSQNKGENFSAAHTRNENEPDLPNNSHFDIYKSIFRDEEESSEAGNDIFSESSQQSCISSGSDSGSSGNSKSENCNCTVRRGRPRSEIITSLMEEGAASKSKIKCIVCLRVFPRAKSLGTHMRIHTGEKPYACDYPGCNKIFTQSGQLKSHFRTHANDRPFVCTYPRCGARYKHSNRFCRGHPRSPLIRDGKGLEGPNIAELTREQIQWLNKYKENRRQALQKTKRQRIKTRENDSGMPKKVKRKAKREEVKVQTRLSLISSKERAAVEGLLKMHISDYFTFLTH